MTKQRPRTAQLIAITFLISLAICSKEQTETEYEKSFDEIKANIEFYESQNNSFITGQFTALKITTRGITTHETLEMYKSLFKTPEKDGKITVLTIKNTHIPEAFSLEKCIESIATAAQNHIYGKRNETTSDDLCITIECVDSAKIAEHSSWNRDLEQVERSEKAFAAFILENLFSIIHKSFIQYIFESMFDFIFENLFKKSLAIYKSEKNVSKAKFDVRSWYKFNIQDFKKFSVENMCKMVSRKAIVDEYSPLSFLKSFVHDYEKRNGYKYFTQNDKAIEQFFIDTVEKYRYFVDQEFKLNVPSLKALVEEIPHYHFLGVMIKHMFRVMIRHFYQTKITLCRGFGTRYYASIFNQKLKFDQTFTEQHQEYYKMISFDLAYLRTSDRDRRTDLIESLRADNVAKIIIRGELDDAVLSRICNTLRSTELLKNFIGYQSMYIDFEREMSKDQLGTSFVTFKSRKRSLDDANPVLDTKFKVIEVFTTVISLHNHNKCDTIQLLTYTTDTVAVKEQQGSQILAKCARIATKTVINIETWFDSHSSARFASSKLVTNDGNQVGRVDVITINDGCKIVKISITRDAKCDLGKETISITYNIWELNGGGNGYGPKQSVGIVKTLPNLPVLYLKGLAQNVYLQQLTTGIDFVIPNLITFDGIDYLYTEIIIDKFYKKFKDFINDQNDRLCKWQNDKKRYAIISRTEMFEVANIVDSNTNHELPHFVKSLDMDDARINRIIYEYLKRERSRKNPTKLPKYLSPLKTDDDVCIFATCEGGSCLVLHICEAVERKYIETPKAISSKVLAKIIKRDEYKKLKIISETKDENRVFLRNLLSEIVVSFYKKTDLTKNPIPGSERQKYINELFYWFDKLKEQEQLFNQLKCNGKENEYLLAIDQYTNTLNCERLFGVIAEEIQNEKNRFNVKVTSVTLGKKKKETARSYENFCAIS